LVAGRLKELFFVNQDNFLEITRQKYTGAVKKARPLIVGFHFTNACNLRCKLCGAAADQPLADELTTQEAYNVIDNMAEAGLAHLSFGGGEPTVRQDLIPVLRYATRRINSVGMVTNGYLLDNKFTSELARAGLRQVMISLDGARTETHDANRGAGSYEKVIQAVKNCLYEGLSTRVSFTINQSNYQELKEVLALAVDLDVALNVQEFRAGGRGAGRDSLVLTREQRREMQRYLFEAQKTYGAARIGFENRYIISEDENTKKICTDPNLSDGFYDYCVGCFTGIYSFFLKSDGEVRLCGRYAEGLLGNLKEKRLSDIWRSSEILLQLRNRDNLKGRCGSCVNRYICGGCRRDAYSMTGDIMAEDPMCWRGR
jgi:radical SAM protein with 4Fe4S-binding SPASM domain